MHVDRIELPGVAQLIGPYEEIQNHEFLPEIVGDQLYNVSYLCRRDGTFEQQRKLHVTPDEAQTRDVDFLLSLGELFTLVVYGQLVIENAKIYKVEDEFVDQIFDFMVRDFSKFALQLYSKTSSTETQMDICMQMIKKPVQNPERFNRIWEKYVAPLNGAYEMNP